MRWLKENIFFRILLPFIAGIILSYYAAIPSGILIAVILLSATLIFIIPRMSLQAQFRNQYLRGIALTFILIAVGYVLKYTSTDINHPQYFRNYAGKDGYSIGRVCDEPVERDKTDKVPVEILSVRGDSGWHSFIGKALIYIKKDSTAIPLQYGDMVLLKTTFSEIRKDRNPHAVDYKFILNNLNIFHSSFTSRANCILLSHEERFNIYKTALGFRNACIAVFNSNIPDHEAASVASSLLLGYRGDMSYELQQAYVAAGVVHILAVSGMQVGLVLALLNFLLFPLERNRYLRLMKVLVMILAVIVFTFMTGISGSVSRAAVMLSLVLVGRQLGRHISSLNILFATAFVLLVIQPPIIFDVGFELSFFAIAGIILFYKPLRGILFTPNKILDCGLSITSMSIAAQAGTMPFVLYYFHQFPVHFMLVNLLVIPLAGLITNGLIVMLAVSFIKPLATLTGVVMMKGINLMDGFVRLAGQLPLSVYYLPHFNLLFLVILSAALVFIYVFIKEKRVLYLNYSLVLLALFFLIAGIFNYMDSRRRNIVVFENSSHLIFSCRNGNEAVLFCSAGGIMENGFFERYLKGYYREEGVNRVIIKNMIGQAMENYGSIRVDGDRIAFLDKNIKISKKNLSITSGNDELFIFPIKLKGQTSKIDKVYIVSEKGPLIIDL